MTDETPLTVAADLATLRDALVDARPRSFGDGLGRQKIDDGLSALDRVEAEIERLTVRADEADLQLAEAYASLERTNESYLAAERALAKAQESADGWQAEAEEYERRLRLYDAPAPWEARLALAEAMCEKHERALAEACGVIDALAGQQAMPDDFWREPLARFRALAASAPQEPQP